MLPLELSTGLCSLNPHVDRLTLSVLLELDHRGDVVGQEFVRGVIRSVERMTYTNVHLLLEGDAGLKERYGHMAGRFELMRELALILNRKRVRRGSIDFDLPEPLIEFDQSGQMAAITRAPRNIAHRIIEEFMLAANEAVAAHLEQAEIPSHLPHPRAARPAPRDGVRGDRRAFRPLARRGRHPGEAFRAGRPPARRQQGAPRYRAGRTRARHLTPPLPEAGRAASRASPEERILNYLMLRSLKQARYSERNAGHFALAADTYTHFTSPIRRYPDLIVHRVLAPTLHR